MIDTAALLEVLSRYYRHRAVTVAAVIVAGALIAIDALTWIELNWPILFGLPLMLAGLSGSQRLLWTLTALLMGTAFVVYLLQRPPGAFADDPWFVNRLMVEAEIAVTAIMVAVLMQALEVLKKRGEAAEAASRRKTRLLASLSHDLRTPLGTINLIAQLIQRTAGPSAPGAQLKTLAQGLEKNVMSVSALLSDALDISALESGRSALRETEFSLNDLLIEERERLGPLAAAKGLSLTVAPAEPDVRVLADRVKLARILGNLLSNAIKFTHSGGVHIDAARTGDGGLLLRVADTGEGVAPEDLARIFDAFVQARDRPPNSEGWGLGLAISRRLAELMGCTITVRSQLDKGSVFTVRLPPPRVVVTG
jgi:signal transduction histidine kinase